VSGEAASREKIVVEKGLAVDPVHDSAPNQPPSPDQPRKAKIIALGERIVMQKWLAERTCSAQAA
jgi:hypothetical protein